jgi:K+-transporting ATPase ATPase B chain
MVRANVIATSGRAVEAAGDVDVLLLDKTGTITLGDRQASAFIPAPGVTEQELADAAQLASLADETPEGRSIVVLAKQRFQLRGRDLAATAHVSQVLRADAHERRRSRRPQLRKGARDAIRKFIERTAAWPAKVSEIVETWRGRRDAARRCRRPRVLGSSSCATSSRAASRALRASCGRWASRPSWSPATTAHRARSRARPASTTSSPRPRRRASSS